MKTQVLSAVYAHLPENPTTIPDFMVVGKLADADLGLISGRT
ncbi:hypothetical protein BN1012_Phect317 [Candidatus Phaeomarinobacter ectocarpi]|uniref:Uncharacterized protein n=1 Tax=Candidatus Phaeomarinibacter ectocarpi TaxID=1458461 RepID=X5MLM3_9HYPH|nr:hypothetical protein [Candidatus Phaeomarinobacter ectocarpi]CDO58531.1 hypothetical protein BN1012_Phect317 [Candidatus Phaeomarinobacter ectocarpi]